MVNGKGAVADLKAPDAEWPVIQMVADYLRRQALDEKAIMAMLVQNAVMNPEDRQTPEPM